MNRDPQLLIYIQIALIGIVMVVGFFFIWRSISRLESRIDELSAKTCDDINACMLQGGCAKESFIPMFCKGDLCHTGEDEEDEDDEDDEDDEAVTDEMKEAEIFSIMKNCFGDVQLQSVMDDTGASFMIFNTNVHATSEEEEDGKEDYLKENPKVVLLDEDVNKNKKVVEETASIAETDTNEFSKSKLKKMPVDALKELCNSRGLSTEGTKPVLIDRILASLPITSS